MDPLANFKAAQKAGWAFFAPNQTFTTSAAARLVTFAKIRPGERVLDVGCGTGVVAVTAARAGARAAGLDLTPELLAVARDNARLAQVDVEWREGDAEDLPFEDGSFDVVLSQFGHMFAPRPDVAIGHMLRVLKPGGTIAFSTWPPELFMGRMFALIGRNMPPPPPGVSPPLSWGDPTTVRERLGAAVRDIVFDHGAIHAPAMSPAHFRKVMEETAGSMIKLVEMLGASDPAKLETVRRELEQLIAEYYADNIVRQEYVMTRAVKV